MPYEMMGPPEELAGEEYPTPIPMSRYAPQMNTMAGPPPPTYAPSEEKGEGINAGGIAGLAGLLGAAIAGPKSNIGNLLHGGVTQYANNQMRKQLEQQKRDSEQHATLVKTVMTKAPELIRQAPNDPGVQELQKMWVEALADDQIISPKEAADLSAKIHALEGKVGDIYEKETAEKARQKEAQDLLDKKDRQAFELLQASHPELQGVKYDDAKKSSWFRKAVDQVQSRQAEKERAFSEAKMGLSDYQTLGGQNLQVPTATAVEADAALRRAREMAAASQNRVNTQQGGQDSRLDEQQRLKLAQDVLEASRKVPPQMWDRMYGPKFRDNVAAAQEYMQSKMKEGMTPPPGGMAPSPNPTPSPTPAPMMSKPPMTGKPLPAGVDPRQLTPEQRTRLQSQGFNIP